MEPIYIDDIVIMFWVDRNRYLKKKDEFLAIEADLDTYIKAFILIHLY